MCSVLIFAKPDNDHPDPKLDWTKFKRGDVIAARDDDNFFWGNDIQGPKALGWCRVVILPGVAASELGTLMGEEVLSYPAPDNAPRKLRSVKVDLDAIEAEAVAVKGQPLDKAEAAAQTKVTLFAKVSVKPETKPSNVKPVGDAPIEATPIDVGGVKDGN